VFSPPYHPYTEALLSAVPVADPDRQQRRIVLDGAMPSPRNVPAGCPFSTRCPRKLGAICETTPPPEHRTNSGHRIACHIPMEQLRMVEPIISTAAE
jgi:peptide/nickel transport system ATP-binding protein